MGRARRSPFEKSPICISNVKSAYGNKALASGLIIKQDRDRITAFVPEKKAVS
jgi:hypothetical protein